MYKYGGAVSLFASENFVTEVGLGVAAHLVLLAEVDLVGFLLLLALVRAAEFGGVHFVLVAVGGVHAVVERGRQLILNVLI